MKTIYDFATVVAFSGLIVLFLHRSDRTATHDPLWHYLVASGGCALVNWLGNAGHAVAAIAAAIGLCAFIVVVIRPFGHGRGG